MHPRSVTGLLGNFRAEALIVRSPRLPRFLGCLAAALTVFSLQAASNVVEYTYDAAGNITQIKRQVAAGFAITSFDPVSGPVGATVTVYGAGFSATPANNTVKFNGTTATVSASDSGSISTTVPTGATTGRITVTVGGNTVTSATDFVVTIPGAPTITSFTPASGASGTTVAVTGTNFDTATNATTVKLNGVTATATIGSSTSISLTVPTAAASGRITATTSTGTGASAQDFIIPPPGVNLADVSVITRLVPDGSSSNVAIGTPGKRALLLFDGAANGHFSIQFGQLTLTPGNATVPYSIIKPDNTVLTTGSISSTSGTYRPTIHLPKLAVGGTYSILVSPGSTTFNSNVKVVADPVVGIDGSAVAIALDTANQTARVVFDASATQNLGLGVTGLTLTPNSTGSSGFRVYLPDGSQLGTGDLASCNTSTSGNVAANCDAEFTTTAAGRYSIIGTPSLGSAATFGIQLSTEVTGTMAADSGADTTLTRVGQDARYTFSVSSGDSFGVALSGMTSQPQVQSFAARVYRPNGTLLAQTSASQPSGAFLELGTLATAGTYSVTLDPTVGAYGTARLTLKQGAMLTGSGSPTAFAPPTIGEAVRFRFAGTAGQGVAVTVSGLAYVGTSSDYSYLNVYDPAGALVGTYITCLPTQGSGGCTQAIAALPSTGTYSAVLTPPTNVKLTGSMTVSNAIAGTLSAGTPQTINATRAGQNATYTFSGTAGDSTSVKLYGISTTPSSETLYVVVNRPSGSFLASNTVAGSAPVVVNLGSLPTTGTYTVHIYPRFSGTWQGTLALDPGVLMTLNGSTQTLATTATGEPLRYRFAGTAGQRVEFGLAGLTYGSASSNTTGFKLYDPSGNQILTQSCGTSGAGNCETWLFSLPSTGTYAVGWLPPPASSITAGIFAISTPVTGTFVIGDPAQSVAIARPGQTLRYTFSGTSGQLLRLNWTSAVVGSSATAAVSVLNPNGTALSSSSFTNGASGGLDVASLPSTGTYAVVIDPTLAATMSASMSLVTR